MRNDTVWLLQHFRRQRLVADKSLSQLLHSQSLAAPSSGKNRLYFCYDCLQAFTATPPVKLPFDLYMCDPFFQRLNRSLALVPAALNCAASDL